MQYDKRSITAYLLGTASESDTERFDELSVVDDDFADAVTIAEDKIVDDYISDQLSGPELDRFKSYYLASPRRRQKVEFARAFRQFADGHANTSVPLNTASKAAPSESILSRLLRFPSLQWGFAAATLLLAVTVGWLTLRNSELSRQADEAAAMRNAAIEREQELRKQLDSRDANVVQPDLAQVPVEKPEAENTPQPDRQIPPSPAISGEANRQQRAEPPAAPRVTIATFILTPPVRSGGKLTALTIPPKTEQARFQIKMEPNDFITHQVELVERSSGRAIWKSGRIRPGSDTVSVNIPAKLFTTGIYSFQVTGISDSGDSEMIGDYYFRIAN